MGGYKTVPPEALSELLNSEMFKMAENAARKEFSEKQNVELGSVVAVKEQVVAGMNYKMTFNSPVGEYDVTVFVQPWTNTYRVTHIERAHSPNKV